MDKTNAEEEPLQLSEAYVHSLASLGLERLQNEPGRLHAEGKAVEEALHSLSLDHYRVFIQNQECVRHVRAQGEAMSGHLSALLSEVHGLGSEFSVFQREAAELVGGHKRNRQTLKHHMQLVELLEVPQLMDACVRSDLMEEALSIATFASTLERRHRSRRAVTSAPGGGSETTLSGTDEADGHLPGVIQMIVDEVRESARGLHERLVAKLRGPIQLTNCLQVVSCLRRLELLALERKNQKKEQRQQRAALAAQAKAGGGKRGIGGTGAAVDGGGSGGGAGGGGGVSQRQLALVEMKLQVDFLEARDAWLAEADARAGHGDLQQQALGGGGSASPYQTLMDLIESSRSQWFEVATQFRAIFVSVEVVAGGRKVAAGKGEESGSDPGGADGGDVLSLWLLRRVSAFVSRLKSLLPLVGDGGSLRSLLEECMFFGASMGRLGTDFRGLLVPVFEERVCSVAAGQWSAASADFVAILADVAAIEASGGNGASLLHVPDKISSSFGGREDAGAVAEKMEAAEAAAAAAAALLTNEGMPQPPPRSLMAFPPVARLVNAVLVSFNQLRECLPASVEARLAEALVLCFADAFRGLADLQKSAVRASAAASAAAAGSSFSSSSMWRDQHNTTASAVELSCVALARQAVPHLAVSFALLFGEVPSRDSKAPQGGGGAGAGGRCEALRSQLLKSMESFGIYEPPAPPPPPIKTPSIPQTPAVALPTSLPSGSVGSATPAALGLGEKLDTVGIAEGALPMAALQAAGPDTDAAPVGDREEDAGSGGAGDDGGVVGAAEVGGNSG